MTQPFPTATPCLVPPSAAPAEDIRPGLRHALELAEGQARSAESDARRLRGMAHEADLKARGIRELADTIRAQLDRLG